MNMLAQLWQFHRLRQALVYDAARLRQLQHQRLRSLVTHAYRCIPYYRQRLGHLGVQPDDLRSLDDLARLPILTKADLQNAPADTLISQGHDPATLIREQTTGSSGRPLVMHLDLPCLRMRNALFLRALVDCGYRPGRRLLMVTARQREKGPPGLGWRYLRHDANPGHNIQRHNDHRPHILYGWVTPIRRMAETAHHHALALHPPHAVITTAETLDHATRQQIQHAFNCPVYEIYGLTECGTIAWQAPGHRHFRISHESLIVEFLPLQPPPDATHEHAPNARRIVVTNLGLRAMPLIRYDTGDLATLAPTETAAMPMIERIDGREVDCLRLGDGRTVSPFELTLAMERVPALVRHQVLQLGPDRVRVRYQLPSANANPAADTDAAAAIASALRGVLGPDVQIDARRETNLDPPPGQKFRVVHCRLHEQGVAP